MTMPKKAKRASGYEDAQCYAGGGAVRKALRVFHGTNVPSLKPSELRPSPHDETAFDVISTTTDPSVAHYYATKRHEGGSPVVMEMELKGPILDDTHFYDLLEERYGGIGDWGPKEATALARELDIGGLRMTYMGDGEIAVFDPSRLSHPAFPNDDHNGYVSVDREAVPIKNRYAGGGAVRKLMGKLSTLDRHTPGKPRTVTIPGLGEVEAAPIKEIEDSADAYMAKAGRPGAHRIDAYEDFDEERAAAIAEAFERMKHDPADPKVKRSYDALIDETLAQYDSLKDSGIDYKFLRDGQGDPYAKSPALGYADIIQNGRLWVFPTDQGFGTSGLFDPSDNPLLKRVGKVGDLDNATANDAFRIVHDAYGHFGPGNPFFRHKGEERAWQQHSKMFSDDALPAMSTETRGQNSWLNFGPHAEHNRTALGGDTVFADQKIGLLPEWAYKGYAAGGFVKEMPKDDLVEDVMFLGSKARGAKRALKELFDTQVPDLKHLPDDALQRELWAKEGIGVTRGGQPMFEIDDSAARLKDIPDPKAPRTPMTLQDAIDHPELFDQYPDLAKLPFRYDRAMPEGQWGALESELGGRPVKMMIDPRRPSDAVLKGILHETQHGVQSIEGWQAGSNLYNANSLVGRQNRLEEKILAAQTMRDALGLGFTPDDILSNMDFAYMHPPDKKLAVEMAQKYSAPEIERFYAEARKQRPAYRDPFTTYELDDAETMARNTPLRHNLDARQRRERFWKDTEDRQGEPRIVRAPDGTTRLSWD